jgi:anti-anti-sigma factor
MRRTEVLGMEMTRVRVGGVTVVRVKTAALDSARSRELEHGLAELAGPDARIVVDLGDVESIDGAGCAALLSCHRRVIQHGGRLKVCGASGPTRLPLQLARIHRRMEVFNTEEEALRAFRL